MPEVSRVASNKRYRDRLKDERRLLLSSILGDHCAICGESPELMTTHRKDGEKHPKFQWKPTAWVQESLESGEYVRLCPVCHRGVHWSMEYMGMKWEDIQAALV